jgi:hypothetical protein
MSTYARIANGAIAELFTTPTGVELAECFVAAVAAQFVDVTSVTPEPQPGWSATETSGAWSFAAPVAPPTTPAVAYGAFIAGGVTVTSTATPALDGVYPIDANTQVNITTEASFITTFGEFTTGGTINLPWQLANGSFVEFPTTASFLAFAKAVGQLVAAAKLALAQSNAMPGATITIP